MLKELEKNKVENKKRLKDYDNKLSTMNNELIKSYAKVDQLFKENVKVQEEKKVLESLCSANEKLSDKENESSSTNPTVEAEKNVNNSRRDRRPDMGCRKCDYETDNLKMLEKHMEIHREKNNLKCGSCDFVGYSETQMEKHFKGRHGKMNNNQLWHDCSKCEYTACNEHLLEEHLKTHNKQEVFRCELCDFQGKLKSQMEKHHQVRHKKPVDCIFWRRGICNKGSKCLYLHQEKDAVCYNGEFCADWSNCKFTHPEICRFQSGCKNLFCLYVHVNNEQPAFLEPSRRANNFHQNQKTMWRPW